MTMTMRIVLYCLLGGLSLTIATAGAGHFGWWWLSGVVLSAAYVPVARFGPRRWWMQFGVILPSLFVVGSLCTESEVWVFFPALRGRVGRDMVGGFVLYLIVAVALAALAKLLRLTEESDVVPEHRAAWAAGGMVLVSGFAYMVLLPHLRMDYLHDVYQAVLSGGREHRSEHGSTVLADRAGARSFDDACGASRDLFAPDAALAGGDCDWDSDMGCGRAGTVACSE